jgi:hypothetical protein
LISDSGELRRVEHRRYANEEILQELIAKHPDLLAGDQIDIDAPPRWLLIRREAAIPDSADGGDRWSVDHLLVDQYGMRRRIPLAVVESVLANPQQKVPEHGDVICYQSKIDINQKEYLVRVIVNERLTPAKAVTVYRTSKIRKYWKTTS